MLTVPALIDSSEERERIARESGASAVDMETEFIARACAAHGIPLLSLRVITDTPTEPFLAPPSVLFDIEQQRTPVCLCLLIRSGCLVWFSSRGELRGHEKFSRAR